MARVVFGWRLAFALRNCDAEKKPPPLPKSPFCLSPSLRHATSQVPSPCAKHQLVLQFPVQAPEIPGSPRFAKELSYKQWAESQLIPGN
jgi:hypothetical protein